MANWRTWQWLSANMVVPSFAIGAIAIPVFGLGFVDSLLTIFFFNILGIIPVCFFSTFGPELACARWYSRATSWASMVLKLVCTLDPKPSESIGNRHTDLSTSRHFQYPCFCGLASCQYHCRRPTPKRSQLECSWLGCNYHHGRRNLHCYPFRLQSSSRLRVLVVDPLFYHFPYHPWRVCTLGLF